MNKLLVIALSIMLSSAAFAGNLDSPGAPGAGSGMPTLQGIYDQLSNGTEAGSSTSFEEPSAGPTAGTGISLSDIKLKLPASDNTNGATAADVLSGKTFWGLRTDGTWGLKSGAISSGSDVSGENGLLNFTIPDGYYSGRTATANDANLVSGNIKSGISIFGIDGKTEVVDTTEGASPAAAGDMLSGKKAFVNGSLVTGTVPAGANITGGNGIKTITITDGLYSGSKTVTANDTNLTPANIKCGTTLFGIRGWYNCKVPKTEQTTSYATGDDGYYHLMYGGIPAVESGWFSFDGRRAIGGWNSSYGNGFVDNGNGTVTDNLTGLIWLKNADCFGAQTWANALTSANGLASGACGLSDGSRAGNWRLPNANEFMSLIDPYMSGNPKLPSGNPFTGFIGIMGYYWTSTTLTSDTSKAWEGDGYYGEIFVHLKVGDFPNHVWPVRGGQ